MGFVRRFAAVPALSVLTAIEGVVVVDQPQPAAITGVDTGTVGLVGECADMSRAVTYDASGQLTTRVAPAETFGGDDFTAKFGGFDETLGEWGGALGSAFGAVRNKRFARLIVAPVDLVTNSSTTYGTRFWRELPTNISATNPTPIVPVSAGVLAAGRQFVNAANRVRCAQRVVFKDTPARVSGTTGDTTSAAAATSQNFTRSAGSWVTDNVVAGDILVLGVIGGAGALGTNAGTYRVVSRTSATVIVVERLDGASFTFATGTAQPWRIHENGTADSAGAVASLSVAFSSASGYVVPARPLDATVASAALLTPSDVPSAGTATSWNALSGLGGATHPSGALTYFADVHAPNAVNSATIDARYASAIAALAVDKEPARDVNLVIAARKSDTIRSLVRTHVLEATALGLTRSAIIAPSLTATYDTAVGAAAPGVGATRSEWVDYAWPGLQHYVPEAVGFAIKGADGRTYTDGMVDDTSDHWLVSIESLLPPERNPGQAEDPVPTIMSQVRGFQRGAADLTMQQYINLKAQGICAPRNDRVTGFVFQSGVTSSIIAGQTNIFRRRMAGFILDSIADLLGPYAKLPRSSARVSDAIAAVQGFLGRLKSEDQPELARIEDFALDTKSGNTPDVTAAGVYVIKVAVRLIGMTDTFLISASIGENVDVSILQAA